MAEIEISNPINGIPTEATFRAPRLLSGAIPWIICGIGALFYCYAYFLRISPSVMVSNLSAHFSINATQVGNLSAFYYYAYTPMQLPVGMIVDRYGARIVLSLACLLCVLGTFMFIHAKYLLLAQMGRFYIGFGSAFAYVCVLKLATLWLPPKRFATAAGLTTAIGMGSAIFSDIVLTHIVKHVGYRAALNSTLIVGIILTGILFAAIRNKPKTTHNTAHKSNTPLSFSQLLSALMIIFKNPQMWLIGIIGCLLYLPASVFLDLWGISYLKAVYHFSSQQAALAVSTVLLGWIISGPIIGAISDHIRLRRLPLCISAISSGTLLSVIFYVPGISVDMLFVLFFIFGFFCGAHPLCFAIGREHNSNKIAGTAIAVTNTLIMLGGVIFQPIAGYLLDATWTHHTVHGIPVYGASSYTIALSVVPIGLLVAAVMSLFLKETHCKVKA